MRVLNRDTFPDYPRVKLADDILRVSEPDPVVSGYDPVRSGARENKTLGATGVVAMMGGEKPQGYGTPGLPRKVVNA